MTIEEKELVEVIGNVSIEKACSVSFDSESKKAGESKKINVRINFAGVALKDVFNAATSISVIKWQNGQGRKIFDSLKNGQIVEIKFAHAGARVELPAERIAKLTAMGLPKDLAELAINNPEEFKARMAKIK